MAPSQRVPRSSRTKPILEVLAQPSVKRVRRTRPKQPAEGSNAPVKSLPLELITHILEDVDSPRTLANASRACRTLQLEAERLLYRKVYVGRVPHVRSLHRALTRSSRRASFVNEFEAHDNGRMTPVILLVMEILLMLTRLEHLKLNLHTQDSWLCNWKMPHDALPRLKYVQTYHFFFVHTICAPHAITHLHLSFNEGENPALNEILRVVRHQLISFKCERASSMVRTPVWSLISDTLDCGLMPKLRYLEVEDISDVSVCICFPLPSAFTLLMLSTVPAVLRRPSRADGQDYIAHGCLVCVA
ncbi:uncharacterized protein B0H18DRAFT_374585 [Fomitopsis serialis]|uniref:uncharacterized protein n=1 Tax=Fomitopsis serialis TaxID=139415 RepID=UPI00200815A9|nr:uncharacterized protein B0H18DRAFT_374585 [Neoantrodia serialis]KAH9925485.1 hypothetical protein B0H18DRAFT_374585 [Neoantrodia serialis]